MNTRGPVHVFAVSGLAAFLVSAAFGQTAPGKVEFEVASVKPAAPTTGNVVMRRMDNPDPGMVSFSNVTLKMMIATAYNVKDYQVTGPDWLASGGFDVKAKIPAGASKEQIPSMLQALLADRFKLALHRETRNLSVYALVVGKNGPKLKEVDTETLKTQAANAGRSGAYGSADAPPPPPPPPGPNGLPDLSKAPRGPGMVMMMNPSGAREMRGQSNISHLVNVLSNFLDRPVVDMTGLTGTYEVDMVWAADDRESGLPGKMLAIPGGPPPPPPAGDAKPGDSASTPAPTLFTAIQDSLGLKLDPRKSDAEFLVIDYAEKVPTEN